MFVGRWSVVRCFFWLIDCSSLVYIYNKLLIIYFFRSKNLESIIKGCIFAAYCINFYQ